jgi:hypothetical protein
MPLSRGEQGGVPTALELRCDIGLGHLSAKFPVVLRASTRQGRLLLCDGRLV